VAFKQRLGKVFLCVVLGFAAFGGACMRPEEIEDLMACMNRPKVAHTLPEERETGDDLIRKLLTGSLPDAEGGEDPVEDVVRGGGPGDGVERP
jgi:hypothetical protein